MNRLTLAVAMLAAALVGQGSASAANGGTITIEASRTATVDFVLDHEVTLSKASYLAQGGINPFVFVRGQFAGFRISDAQGKTRLATLITRVSGIVPATISGDTLEPGRYRVTVVAPGGGTKIVLSTSGNERLRIVARSPSRARGFVAPLLQEVPGADIWTGGHELPERGFLLSSLSVRETQALPIGTLNGDMCVESKGSNLDCAIQHDSQWGWYSTEVQLGAGKSRVRYFLRAEEETLPAAGALEVRARFAGGQHCDQAVITTLWIP